MRSIWRVLSLWRGHAALLWFGLLVSLGALAAGVGLMTASGELVAGVVLGAAGAAPLLVRVLGPARVGLRYVERLVTHDATFRALADLRVWFFQGLAARSAGGLGFRRAGDMLARLVGDVEALDGLYIRIIVPLIGAAVLLPALVVLLARADAVLAGVVGVLFAVGAFGLPLLAARLTAAAGDRLASAGSGLRVSVLDAVSGLREIRAFGAEGRILAGIQAREGAMLAAQHAVTQGAAWANAGAFLCGQAAILAVLTASGAHPTLAVALTFLTVAAFEAVGGLPASGALAGRAMVAARRVVNAAEGTLGGMTVPPEPALPAPLPAGSALRFEGVRFGWREGRPPVFDGLTLDIPAGSRVAVLGPSGAGKSTLAALALKVVAPERGQVTLGGVDIATLSATDLRSRVGWLSQTTHLFADTIRANLRLARPDADDAAMWAALEAARIAAFVRGLPDGLDAWVGEAGANFSGGQGRRLALARAMLSPAVMLILDEPCAGLDSETERDFFATLNATAQSGMAQGRTIILIAHRLTGLEQVDRIWRLSAGHAVAAAG